MKIVILDDLTEEKYVYDIDTEDEDDAREDALHEFSSAYLNILTEDEYKDICGEDLEEE